MVRKSGIGKQSGDDFGKFKKVPKIDSIRQSNRFSFRVPENKDDLTHLNDACGFEEIHTDSDLLDSRGRKFGETVFYDPVQLQNYKSQAERYERAINLNIDRIYEDAAGKTVYAFCSKNSPTGYWEVRVAGGTFIDVPNPLLVIICPRPFQASELMGVITSDGDDFRWSQLQGRVTIISPTEGGKEVLNPYISIIGSPNPLDPPIQLLLEMLSNPLVFRIVQITTTPTSDQYGKAFASLGAAIAPSFKVGSAAPAPTRSTGGALYQGEAIAFTWSLPTSDTAFVVQTAWLQNTVGSYDLVATFPVASSRLFTVTPNAYYSSRADFDTGLKQYSTESDAFGGEQRFRWQYPIPQYNRIFAEDTHSGKAFAAGKCSFIRYQLTVVTLSPTDSFPNTISFSPGRCASTRYQLKVITQQATDSFPNTISFSPGRCSFIKYQLGGVIIG